MDHATRRFVISWAARIILIVVGLCLAAIADDHGLDWPWAYAVPCVILAATVFSRRWREGLVVTGAWLIAFGVGSHTEQLPILLGGGAVALAAGILALLNKRAELSVPSGDRIEGATSSEPTPEQPPAPLSTRWLSFWIYFRLPVGAVFGTLSSMQQPDPDAALRAFVVSGSIGAAAIAISVGLQRRRLWAWRANWALLILEWLVASVSRLPESRGDATVFFLTVLVGLGIVWVLPNSVYFYKRRRLFSREQAL